MRCLHAAVVGTATVLLQPLITQFGRPILHYMYAAAGTWGLRFGVASPLCNSLLLHPGRRSVVHNTVTR